MRTDRPTSDFHRHGASTAVFLQAMAHFALPIVECMKWMFPKSYLRSRLGVLRGVAQLLLLTSVVLTACKGPNAQAGRDQDKAAAQSCGEIFRGGGPNQRLGKAQDRADDADRQLSEANGDAIKARARELLRSADVKATRLDEQAKAIRASANVQAHARHRLDCGP